MSSHQLDAGDSVERMTVTDVGRLLWRRRRSVLAVAGGVLALVLVVTLLSPLSFRIQSSLYLGELQVSRWRPGGSPTSSDFLGGRGGDVGTEIELLKSRTLLQRAVLTSGLNVSLAPHGEGRPSYWRWRLARRNPRLLDAGARLVYASNAELPELRAGVSAFTVRFEAGGRYEIAAGDRRLGAGTLGTPFKQEGLSVTLSAGPEGPPSAGARFTMEVTPVAEAAESVSKDL